MADKLYAELDGNRGESFADDVFDGEEQVTDLGHLEGERVPPTNDMALVSLLAGVGGWILAVGGICPLLQAVNVCLAPLAFGAWALALFSGFVARSQIAETADGGDDLAVWGMAAGGAGMAAGTLLLLVLAVAVLALGFQMW